MKSNVRFFPIGNADTCVIDAGGKKFIFDFAAPKPQGGDDRRIDLAETLRDEFKRENRTSVEVVSFSHLDTDHFAGASEFFHLEHAKKYQGGGRIHIKEMWVPAAAILESRLEQSHEGRVIQAEARHRLKMGKGIRIISRPGLLDQWLKEQDIDPQARRHLIVGAGKLMPGFSRHDTGIEFFVHSPFADQGDEGEVNRNDESTVFHVKVRDGSRDVKLLLTADTTHEVLSRLVRTTERARNRDRLEWDIIKVPHHSSYKSLGPHKGKQVTTPVPEVRRLYEDYGQPGGIIVSPSKVIPNSDEIQPPHRQAAAYYKDVAKKLGGNFIVTMEHPTRNNPKPVNLGGKIGGRKGSLNRGRNNTGRKLASASSIPVSRRPREARRFG